MTREAALLAGFPAPVRVDPREIAAAVAAVGRILVVLDDDPTGTQSVADLPVLTAWEPGDFEWAFSHRIHGAAASAVYVLTNTRSLDPAEAEQRNRDIVTNALAAADASGVSVGFVSRGDSTLRGHFPLEPDTIAATLREVRGIDTDGVVIVPAFPDAGRVTIGGIHYLRDGDGGLTAVAETEFARDATFGFTRSDLAGYVEEKSGGRLPAGGVILLDLATIRGGTDGIAAMLDAARDAVPIVADAVTEDDLRALALGLHEAERRGRRLLYRVGPPFVRARIGQVEHAPLTAAEIFDNAVEPGSGEAGATDPRSDAPGTGGLIVVGSHVGLTTRQLEALARRHPSAVQVELAVETLLDPVQRDTAVAATTAAVTAGLGRGEVILSTSRQLIRSDDPERSLEIARLVSQAVVDVVRATLAAAPVRFVIAKGGITSSDVAAHGLGIRHAVVRGPMLPGIVSLWEPVDGPARGIPFVVFAGNVGDDESLADVVQTLSAHPEVLHAEAPRAVQERTQP
ncbi:four-carbon acid sugar kinase family protein [Arthrobacter zhaoguopingii]|uniref:four-carbon acid sugar kinase family protein n=1 Tax=Arthrobacter zhaoguopingii TaxID=2681491 RepID=UPI00135C8009|nr:four-carbon acid sugar kinase family protein [Arthrobacter zhaoguopingii]